MRFNDLFRHSNALQQTLFLAAIGRTSAATLTLLFLLLSQFFQWGAAAVHFHWPIIICFYFAIVVLSILSWHYRQLLNTDNKVFSLLIADAGLWFFLLKETGGAMNPATSYFLVMLSLSALALTGHKTISLFIVIISLYTLMMINDTHTLHSMMGWHLWGMWLSFFMTAFIITLSIHYLSTRIQAKDQAIHRFKESTTRAEQLIMMGTLAASTAHEIGTPLSTIALLAEALPDDQQNQILKQVQRCKRTLEQLKNLPDEHRPLNASGKDFLATLKNDLLLIRPQAQLDMQAQCNPVLTVPLTLRQALLALMVNAIDATSDSVSCTFSMHDQQISWKITHYGTPIKEPFFGALGRESTKAHGLGIGYFLANASIEQLKGHVHIANHAGAVITQVAIPHHALIKG